MSDSPCILWFRRDLRLSDNPALRAAADSGRPIVPVFLWTPDDEGRWAPGGAARAFAHQTLKTLAADLEAVGLGLVVRRGEGAEALLPALCAEVGAEAVYYNERYEPAAKRAEARAVGELESRGVVVEGFQGSVLFDADEVHTKGGEPYKVFTPFAKAARALEARRSPSPAPERGRLRPPARWPAGLGIDDLGLMPEHPWGRKVASHWPIGETAARRRMHRFCGEGIFEYKRLRDRPDLDATSRLSPHLHWGAVSAHQVWEAGLEALEAAETEDGRKGCQAFLNEVLWREFSYHLLRHFPRTPDENLRSNFDAFPWTWGGEALERWRGGRTGYPIVDAAMRQLWETGWMHNRLRMIAGSLLTKDLLVHWLEGARWFWDTLVDADLANNTQGWQWTAGCGADAQPFFRIFNPTTQAKRFDPEGDFVRKWVPELAGLEGGAIHEPWEAGMFVDYPEPIVDHKAARDRALAAFEEVKGG